VLGAGGSNFSVDRSSKQPRVAGTTQAAHTGSVVSLVANLSQGRWAAVSANVQASTSLIELEGRVRAVSSSSLTLGVEGGSATTIVVPASVTLRASIVAGTFVQALVSWDGTSFTLVTLSSDNSAANSPSSGVSRDDNGQSSAAEIEGQVVAADAGTLTIQPGDNAAAVVVSIPSGFTMPAVAVGDFAHVRATLVSGVLTLVSLQVHAAKSQEHNGSVEVSGVVISVSADTLRLQPGDNAAAVSFVVPSTVDVSKISVGDQVHARGTLSSGTLTLVSYRSRVAGSGEGTSSEVDGTVAAVSASSLSIQPGDHAPVVVVAVPSGVDVSALQVGNFVRASVAVVSGTLTLVSYSASASEHEGNGQRQADGTVVSVTASSLVLSAGDHGLTVMLVVPNSVDVSALVADQRVHVVFTKSGDTLTLVSFTVASQTGGDSSGSSIIDAHGLVTSVSATQLVLSLEESKSLTLVVPSSVDVSSLSVGVAVHVSATKSSGTTTLVSFVILPPRH